MSKNYRRVSSSANVVGTQNVVGAQNVVGVGATTGAGKRSGRGHGARCYGEIGRHTGLRGLGKVPSRFKSE